MAGVRLGHSGLRNTTLVLFHPVKKYKNGPYLCPKCGTSHVYKSYHLDLDDQGTVIVSVGVFNALRELGLPGLTILNEVAKPPPQHLAVGGVAQMVGSLVSAKDAKKTFGRLDIVKNRLLKPRLKAHE